MFLKNINTGAVGEFANHQGDDWIELTGSELTNHKKQKLKDELIAVRKSYLASKDKYWIQKMREGKEVSQEIIDKSNLAVREINQIEVSTTLSALNKFSVEF